MSGRALKYVPYSANPNNALSTHPCPSLKQGGERAPDFPQRPTPPCFREGQGWVFKDQINKRFEDQS